MARKKSSSSAAPDEAREELQKKLHQTLGTLVADNLDKILSNAGTDDVAKASISIKINNCDTAPQCFLKLRWSKRFSGTAEFSVDDPDQGKLFDSDDGDREPVGKDDEL